MNPAWTKQIQALGWNVSRETEAAIELSCAHIGCPGRRLIPHDALHLPEPCEQRHAKGYGHKALGEYERIIGDLRSRRVQFGLSQEDVNAAIGLTDGHINKLESFAKIARLPTLALWSKALGYRLAFIPDTIPPVTLRAIESREAKPYDHSKAHFAADRLKALPAPVKT